jgi:hypothetical protein
MRRSSARCASHLALPVCRELEFATPPARLSPPSSASAGCGGVHELGCSSCARRSVWGEASRTRRGVANSSSCGEGEIVLSTPWAAWAACFDETMALQASQHTSAYASIRIRMAWAACFDETMALQDSQHTPAYASIRQHTPAYASIRQYTSADVSVRQQTSADVSVCIREQMSVISRGELGHRLMHTSAYVSIRQHT